MQKANAQQQPRLKQSCWGKQSASVVGLSVIILHAFPLSIRWQARRWQCTVSVVATLLQPRRGSFPLVAWPLHTFVVVSPRTASQSNSRLSPHSHDVPHRQPRQMHRIPKSSRVRRLQQRDKGKKIVVSGCPHILFFIKDYMIVITTHTIFLLSHPQNIIKMHDE